MVLVNLSSICLNLVENSRLERSALSKMASGSGEGASTVICLFRNDLRYHDNEALQWADRNGDHVLPLYCFDPHHFGSSNHFGFEKTAQFRAKLLIEAVEDLRQTLLKHGSNLVVRHQNPVEAVKELISTCNATAPVRALVLQKEVTEEDFGVEVSLQKLAEENNITLQSVWGLTLYHKADIPFPIDGIPDTFTKFQKSVETQSSIRDPVLMPDKLHPLPPDHIKAGQVPSLSTLGVKEREWSPPTNAFPFPGGETPALQRLQDYLWGSDAVATYKDTRDGLLGENYSTKFSPWLALGSLSPRQIHAEIRRYEAERVANQSTSGVLFELIWRDYFKFVCLRYGNSVFQLEGIMGKSLPWKRDEDQFKAWQEGRTGVPFVDANMRELLQTGWMSNRGRQNVASFLVNDLGLDWRLGAEWFESMLLDHDVCSNYGNWNYAAGIGNDPQETRKFNMIKQGLDYDPDGKYIRAWTPELKELHGSKIHIPWTLSPNELETAKVSLGETYPNPIVIAPEWGL